MPVFERLCCRALGLRLPAPPRTRARASGRRLASTKARNYPLFVTGDRGTNTTCVVIPDLDHHQRLGEELARSLRLRNQQGHFDLERLRKGLEYLRYFQGEEERLEAEAQELVEERKALDAEEEKEKVSELVSRTRKLRRKIQLVKRDRWAVEESVAIPLLELPNVVSSSCPEKEEKVLVSRGTWPAEASGKGHVELAGESLEFSPFAASSPYLMDGLARAELDLSERAQELLLAEGFFMMANPDLAKSVAVEGCGGDFSDPGETLALRETVEFGRRETGQAMHLLGGASLAPFVSFFSKNVVKNPSLLPRSFFCVGRHYAPLSASPTAPLSLFSTQQSTAVEIFTLSADDDDDKVLAGIVNAVDKFYSEHSGLPHFRLVDRCAHRLGRAESRRISVEAPAPGLGSYVEVGSVSCYGDYLARRMMLKASQKQSPEGEEELLNLRAFGGTLVDVTKLIGCLLECGLC